MIANLRRCKRRSSSSTSSGLRSDVVDALIMSGIETVEKLLIMSAEQICKCAGLDESEVAEAKACAASMGASEPQTAFQLFGKEGDLDSLPSGDAELDTMLGGGFPRGRITEIFAADPFQSNRAVSSLVGQVAAASSPQQQDDLIYLVAFSRESWLIDSLRHSTITLCDKKRLDVLNKIRVREVFSAADFILFLSTAKTEQKRIAMIGMHCISRILIPMMDRPDVIERCMRGISQLAHRHGGTALLLAKSNASAKLPCIPACSALRKLRIKADGCIENMMQCARQLDSNSVFSLNAF